jgi:type I restriction enzyme S subunit
MLTHRFRTILGDIPHDWGTFVLRDALDLPACAAGDWGDDAGQISLKAVRSTNITNDGQLTLGDVAVRHYSPRKASELALVKNDILLERSGGGPDQPVGRVVFLRDDLGGYAYGNFIHRLRAKDGFVEPRFLYYCLFELHRSGIVEKLQYQTTQMRNLDWRDYSRLMLPLPPPEEQCLIVNLIDAVDDVIQVTKELLGITASLHRDQTHGAMSKLKAAMLQNLVTGRVRLQPVASMAAE